MKEEVPPMLVSAHEANVAKMQEEAGEGMLERAASTTTLNKQKHTMETLLRESGLVRTSS